MCAQPCGAAQGDQHCRGLGGPRASASMPAEPLALSQCLINDGSSCCLLLLQEAMKSRPMLSLRSPFIAQTHNCFSPSQSCGCRCAFSLVLPGVLWADSPVCRRDQAQQCGSNPGATPCCHLPFPQVPVLQLSRQCQPSILLNVYAEGWGSTIRDTGVT